MKENGKLYVHIKLIESNIFYRLFLFVLFVCLFDCLIVCCPSDKRACDKQEQHNTDLFLLKKQQQQQQQQLGMNFHYALNTCDYDYLHVTTK